tara:strand:- start:124 stop:1308 length:1185 start_codon:yes stop_codon:yes gene_type:complete
MKLGLMALAALTAAIIFVGCGTAVGRATGADVEPTNTNTSAGSPPVITEEKLIVVNENLASQEALLVDQEKALDKHQAELQNLKEIVTAFESNSANNSANTESSADREIKSVAAEVSNMSNQLENDMAAQGQHLEEEISMMHYRITSLEEQSAFIQTLLGDIQDEAEAIRYSISAISNEIEESAEITGNLIHSFDAIVSTTEGFQGQLRDLEDETAFLNVAVEQSTSAIEQLDDALEEVDDALEEVEETQEELAGSSNYPITVDQFTTYDNLIGNGLIGDVLNSMPAPETMVVPDCTGPDGTRECIDKLVNSVNVGVDGTYESIQLSINDFCQAAENAYGLERVHGNRWDSTAPTDETDALLNAGFISESEFSIIQWSLKNRDILETEYPGTEC